MQTEVGMRKKSQCCGCGACMAVCARHAIRMAEDWEGIPYPQIDQKKCIHCGQCEAVCPLERQSQEKRETRERKYLGAQAKEDPLRFTSSSGGVFPVLARQVLLEGGVVFGAVMGKEGRVFHRGIEDVCELPQVQKTKYVQSDLQGCYSKIARYVKAGRQVLFTGTPCQCQAVKRYLGKEYENLLLADLVCYGAPSPGIWRSYVKELEKKYGGTFSGFGFRDKRAKDNGHTVSVQIEGKEYAYPMKQDSFCRVYFRNYTIRPSCQECPFCTVERESDLTMGDFWGIEKVKPEVEDGMGTSLVILHTKKAEEFWDKVQEQFRFFSCKKEEILQPRLCTPTPKSGRRFRFMLLYHLFSVCTAEKLLRR